MVLTPRALLTAAAAVAMAFVVLLLLAYWSPGARWLDAAALEGFLNLQGPGVTSVTARLVKLGDPAPFALMGCMLAGVALARGRPRVAGLVLVLLAVTSVSSQLLKGLLAYPRADAKIADAHIDPAAFPSGHATAAMTLAIALVLVMPARLRLPAGIVGVGIALGVSFSIVSFGWHLPSDAVGGFLLATGWALVLLAALRAADGKFPESTGRTRAAAVTRAAVDRAAAVGLTAVLVAGAVLTVVAATMLVVFRLPEVVDYAQDHTAFVVVAAAIAVSAAGLLGMLVAALTRRG